MLAIILSILGTWVVLGAIYGWMTETNNGTLYNILEGAITLPWMAFGAVCIIVWYPLLCIWKFFRNAVKGVSAKCWETHKPDHYWKTGNLYWCYDKRARALCNKLFLVRVVVPRETIAHYPVLMECDDTPSTPSGEFR